MIDYRRSGAHHRATTGVVRPLIYLDHWALRHFSEHPEDRARLLTPTPVIGTFALSMFNMLEIANHEDGESVTKLDELLGAIGTNWCLLDCNPLAVSAQAAANGESEEVAAIAQNLTQAYITGTGLEPSVVSAEQFVSWTREAREDSVRLMEDAKLQFTRLFRNAQKEFRRTLALPQPELPGSRVQVCFIGLLRDLLLRHARIRQNDVIDLFHAAVPISVCDFVLLDGSWTRRAMSIPYPALRARVYSNQNGQLAQFLKDLEAARLLPPSAWT